MGGTTVARRGVDKDIVPQTHPSRKILSRAKRFAQYGADDIVFWNVCTREKQRNSIVYREIDLTLEIELSLARAENTLEAMRKQCNNSSAM